VEPYGIDKLCFLTPSEADTNFKLAASNLKNVNLKSPQEFNVPDMLLADYIFVTKQGIAELEQIIESRETNYYRVRKVSSEQQLEKSKSKRADKFATEIIDPILTSDKIENYNDELPLKLQSEALRTYIDDLRRLQQT